MSCTSPSLSNMTTRYAPSLSGYSCVAILLTTFYCISYSSDGGAVYVSGSVSFNANGSTFIGCSCTSSTGSGGALYTDGLSSSSFQYNCFYDCYCAYYFQAFRLGVGSGCTSLVKNVALRKCPSDQQGVAYSGHVYTGIQTITYVNASNNMPSSRVTGLIIQGCTSCTHSYCTYANSKGDIVLELNGASSATSSMISIFNNTKASSDKGTVYFSTSSTIQNSVFTGNHQTYMFYSEASATLTVSTCYFDTTFSTYGTVSLSNNYYGSSYTSIIYSFPTITVCINVRRTSAFTVGIGEMGIISVIIDSLPILVLSA